MYRWSKLLAKVGFTGELDCLPFFKAKASIPYLHTVCLHYSTDIFGANQCGNLQHISLIHTYHMYAILDSSLTSQSFLVRSTPLRNLQTVFPCKFIPSNDPLKTRVGRGAISDLRLDENDLLMNLGRYTGVC